MPPVYVIAALMTFAYSAAAYDNPPDNYCGNPPQYRYCNYCHGTNPLNGGDGYLLLAGLPSNGFIPNHTYNLTLTLADSGQSRWAFEITAEYFNGFDWVQAGFFTITQPMNTQLSVGGGSYPDFVKNTYTGTFTGTPGPTSWQFNWVAPEAAVASISFYFAGNACNASSGSGGDYVYGDEVVLNQYSSWAPPAVVVSVDGDNIILTWNSVPQADEYHIFYDDTPYFIPQSTPQVIVQAPVTNWTDAGAVNLRKRYYIVKAESD